MLSQQLTTCTPATLRDSYVNQASRAKFPVMRDPESDSVRERQAREHGWVVFGSLLGLWSRFYFHLGNFYDTIDRLLRDLLRKFTNIELQNGVQNVVIVCLYVQYKTMARRKIGKDRT